MHDFAHKHLVVPASPAFDSLAKCTLTKLFQLLIVDIECTPAVSGGASSPSCSFSWWVGSCMAISSHGTLRPFEGSVTKRRCQDHNLDMHVDILHPAQQLIVIASRVLVPSTLR